MRGVRIERARQGYSKFLPLLIGISFPLLREHVLVHVRHLGPAEVYLEVCMGLRINTNVQSLVAQRYFGVNSGAQRDSLEHLASGTRINRAADDAAGLAISEKMRAQIRSVRQ